MTSMGDLGTWDLGDRGIGDLGTPYLIINQRMNNRTNLSRLVVLDQLKSLGNKTFFRQRLFELMMGVEGVGHKEHGK